MKPTNWRYQLQQYGTAFVVAATTFAALGLYLFARRGYFNLFIANKALAAASLILLGIVLIVRLAIYVRHLQWKLRAPSAPPW